MKIIFAVCGSFCCHDKAIKALKELVGEGYDVQAVLSEASSSTDTRFGKASDLIAAVEAITGHKAMKTIAEVEDGITGKGYGAAVICPCTGNTLSKIRHGITDTSVTMAVKCMLRNNNPVVIAFSTNDGMGASYENIAVLRNRKYINLVPYAPDNLSAKPNSLASDFSKISETLKNVLPKD